jgi:hypothetical protein
LSLRSKPLIPLFNHRGHIRIAGNARNPTPARATPTRSGGPVIAGIGKALDHREIAETAETEKTKSVPQMNADDRGLKEANLPQRHKDENQAGDLL